MMLMKKTAEQFAKEQKEISISEFFEKNKHLLGFDNPTKALLMGVKEAVDNSLDAAEEAGILPEITVRLKSINEDKYRVFVQDNGPGIVKAQIPNIFGKLLYGSKFHRLRQSRGQQGIGISATVLYSQLTTGKATRVRSKIGPNKKINYFELLMNTARNEPEIIKETFIEDGIKEHGLSVEMDMIGRYRKVQGVDDYLKQTSIANPFAKIIYSAPDGTKLRFPRSINDLPRPPKEIKMHPYGVEFGILQRMLGSSQSKTLQGFLVNEFSSIGATSSKEMCKMAKLNPGLKPRSLTRDQTEKLLNAMQKIKVQRPPLDVLSPIGEKNLEASLKKEYPETEFISTVTRKPEVYRGNPFQIEVGIVYGSTNTEGPIQVIRFANRVPLLYQAGACATAEAARGVDWRRYGLSQSAGSLPYGPIILVIHMCSVWVPFVSESKEAIAPYPDIVKEMKLAIQDAGRKLSSYLSGKRRQGEQQRRIQVFERYAHEVAGAIANLTDIDNKKIEDRLKELIGERVHIKEEYEEVLEESKKKQDIGEKTKEESEEIRKAESITTKRPKKKVPDK